MTKPCLPELFTEPESTFREKKAVNVPRTSVLAYQAIHKEGRAVFVAEWLKGGYTRTSAELAKDMHDEPGDVPLKFVLYVRRGLSDALALGLVEHAGQRVCRVSGRTCITWRLRQR